MTRPHILFLAFILLLAGYLLLRPKEQPLRVEPTNVQATPPCAPAAPVNPCTYVDCNRVETGRLA